MTHTTHPSDEQLSQKPDDVIDRALHSLRAAQPPSGLEQRVAARLAQTAKTHTTTSPFATSRTPLSAVILSFVKDPRVLLAPAPLYTMASTALLAITLTAVNHHHKPTPIAHSNPQPFTNPTQSSNPAKVSNRANTQVPRGFSLGSHSSIEKEEALAPDPDTLALAETLAPSQPAPIMPLTAQERLLLLSTRQGQPIELAELTVLRQPGLQAAAEARERATIRSYIHSLLGPLAAVEAMNPTPSSSQDGPIASAPPSSR